MAYAAVISLKQTINGLVHSSRISLISSTRESLGFAYDVTTSLQKVVETLYDRSSERLDGLDGEIRDCANELEDALEFHESEQSYSQDEDVEVKKAIASFTEAAKKLEVEYAEELSKAVAHKDDATVPSNIDSGVEMVGLSQEFNDIRAHLLSRMRPHDMCFYLFHWEVGCGSRIVANQIFKDLGNQFDCCAWVTIGHDFQLKEVLMQILSQLDSNHPDGHHDLLVSEVCDYLCQVLENRRYMIVLDDVRHVEVVEYLRKSLPNRRDGSIVFVTSSLREVVPLADDRCEFGIPDEYFEEFVWVRLRAAIFGTHPVSSQLEEAGKKIVRNCRCRLLSAAKTLLFLHKTDKTVEQWCRIAADEENPLFLLGDELLEIRNIHTEMQSCNFHMDGQIIENSVIDLILRWGFRVNVVENIKKIVMHPERFFSKMQIISLLGMAGIGKSTLARKIFDDESISCHFDHRVWVTLGPKYQVGEVLIDILAQIFPHIDKMHMRSENQKVALDLCVKLSGKRCFIILDDLWSQDPLHHLKNVWPHIMGTTMVTTRLAQVAKFREKDDLHKMQLLDDEKSWCLLRQKVFAQGSCPRQLEKAGRKIAKNCEGLPLLILTVADELLKVEMSPEYWNIVALGVENLVFKNAFEKISKALLPSYKVLPQHLKACFLYLGVFRNIYEIPTSKLNNLWVAEGFLEPNSPQTVEDFVEECLFELVDRSLVMVHSKVSDSQIETCRLHPVFWHLANSEAAKNNFFHAMNKYVDCPIESIQSQRRLCIRNNILLGLKDVQESMESLTTTHSLLCVGPPHQYPVPINFNYMLMRVMDALTIRFYEFPVEVVKLVHLRHLGLTCNGNLPTSISNLWKLQHLIVRRYMNIKSSRNASPLPMEIWDMKELIHLQVYGGLLPEHKCGNGLLKLSTLLDVSAESCREEVLKKIPNLKRLGIRIELAPDDQGTHYHYLNNIHFLRGLESLKCVVVNPQMRSEVAPLPPPHLMFPPSLNNLSLSGMGYPWEYMSIISELENLEVLKLKRYAFQGPKWIMDHRGRFNKLTFLSVEDTNLAHWEIKLLVLRQLKRLSFKHCYKLQELPMSLPYHFFTKMELVDCNPSFLKWAEDMRNKPFLTTCKVMTHVSWHGRVACS